ncbi:hypothetical protein C2R46_05175 [Helicobacter pylori]|nr:hypothetical protein C2R46_05175 [Helicobacter pylori]
MLEIYYKKDFLKEIKRFCDHFPQKLKGFFKKSGVIFEFWGVCMRLVKNYRLLGTRSFALLKRL